MKWRDHWRGYRFIGGNLALDFVNTVGNRRTPGKRADYLRTQRDLTDWARLAGFAAGREQHTPLRDAVRLREALYRMLAARLKGVSPRQSDIRCVNWFVRQARMGWMLRRRRPGYQWEWTGADQIAYPLARVAESAAELLTSADLELLRQCRDADCGWLFLDRSKGQRRKWCSMKDCGNRAKVRRFFARRRGDNG